MTIVKNIVRKTKGNYDLLFWMIVFVFAVIAGLLVQLVIIPHIFSSWHAGDGLIKGSDAVGFHHSAQIIASQIKEEGWKIWNIYIDKRGAVSIAAVLYALIYPIPLVLIPLNAAMHAFTAVIAKRILEYFAPDTRVALLSAMPIAFFPTAMLWYTQIHSDGYQFLGAFLYIYGFIGITRYDLLKTFSSKEMIYPLYSIIGILLMWIARPHSLVIVFYISVLIFVIAFVLLVARIIRTRYSIIIFLIQIMLLIIIIGTIIPLKTSKGASKYQHEVESIISVTDAVMDNNKSNYEWSRSGWLPKNVEDQFFSIAYLRDVTYKGLYIKTASGIDYDVSFHNVYDFIFYLPRALQITFFAPFPNDWLGEGKYESTTFFRRIAAFEMIFIYLMLPFLAYGIWQWRKKLELWILVIFCNLMMMPIIYSVPNVGTIYRYRYGYLMLLVSLGLAAFIVYILKPFIADRYMKRNAQVLFLLGRFNSDE